MGASTPRFGITGFAETWNGGSYLVYVDGVEFACCVDRAEGLRLMYGVLNASTSSRIHLLKL